MGGNSTIKTPFIDELKRNVSYFLLKFDALMLLEPSEISKVITEEINAKNLYETIIESFHWMVLTGEYYNFFKVGKIAFYDFEKKLSEIDQKIIQIEANSVEVLLTPYSDNKERIKTIKSFFELLKRLSEFTKKNLVRNENEYIVASNENVVDLEFTFRGLKAYADSLIVDKNKFDLDLFLFELDVKIAEIDDNLSCISSKESDLVKIKRLLKYDNFYNAHITNKIYKIIQEKCEFIWFKLNLRRELLGVSVLGEEYKHLETSYYTKFFEKMKQIYHYKLTNSENLDEPIQVFNSFKNGIGDEKIHFSDYHIICQVIKRKYSDNINQREEYINQLIDHFKKTELLVPVEDNTSFFDEDAKYSMFNFLRNIQLKVKGEKILQNLKEKSQCNIHDTNLLLKNAIVSFQNQREKVKEDDRTIVILDKTKLRNYYLYYESIIFYDNLLEYINEKHFKISYEVFNELIKNVYHYVNKLQTELTLTTKKSYLPYYNKFEETITVITLPTGKKISLFLDSSSLLPNMFEVIEGKTIKIRQNIRLNRIKIEARLAINNIEDFTSKFQNDVDQKLKEIEEKTKRDKKENERLFTNFKESFTINIEKRFDTFRLQNVQNPAIFAALIAFVVGAMTATSKITEIEAYTFLILMSFFPIALVFFVFVLKILWSDNNLYSNFFNILIIVLSVITIIYYTNNFEKIMNFIEEKNKKEEATDNTIIDMENIKGIKVIE